MIECWQERKIADSPRSEEVVYVGISIGELTIDLKAEVIIKDIKGFQTL
jgi:hypothetical protein